MKLMCNNKEVAKLVSIENKLYMELIGSPTFDELPACLFINGNNPYNIVRRIDYERFVRWLKGRVVPENRDKADLDRILKYHKMDRYDAFELAVKTKGVSTCRDSFWVDFEDSESSGENPIKW